MLSLWRLTMKEEKVFEVFSPAFLEVLDCFGVVAVVSVE